MLYPKSYVQDSLTRMENLLFIKEINEIGFCAHLFILIGLYLPLIFPLKSRNTKKEEELFNCHIVEQNFLNNLAHYVSFFCGFTLFLNINEKNKKILYKEIHIREFLDKYKLPLSSNISQEFKFIRADINGVIKASKFYLRHYKNSIDKEKMEFVPIINRNIEGRNTKLLMIVMFHLAFMHSSNIGNLQTKAKLINSLHELNLHKLLEDLKIQINRIIKIGNPPF